MKYLKTFENYTEETNEVFGLFKNQDEKAFKRTSEFVNGDSEEAKKVKELYTQIEKDKEGKMVNPKVSDKNDGLIKQITRLGLVWAQKNKMEGADYTFKQIATVLDKDFSRKFKGGPDLNIGESVKNKRK